MNKFVPTDAAKSAARYAGVFALVLGIAVGSAGVAGAEPVTTQGTERSGICNVIGRLPVIASIAGCTTGSPGKPTIPGWPPTTITKTIER